MKFNEGYSNLVRELSKAKRMLSMKKRLTVNMNGYTANYEEIK